MNPKLLLLKYLNTTKYFSRFLTPTFHPKFKRVTNKVLSKVLYILNRNKRFKLSSLDPNYFLRPKAFLHKKQARPKDRGPRRKRSLKSAQARMDSMIRIVLEPKPVSALSVRNRIIKNS